MVGLVLVLLTLAGSSAFVWSLIMQSEGAEQAAITRRHAGADGSVGDPLQPLPALGRRLVGWLAAVPARLLEEARRAFRTRRQAPLDAEPRQLQFEEMASLAPPLFAESADQPAERGGWDDRPSRLVAALELVVLILLVGGVLAAATLGTASVVARIVAAHFAG